MYPILIFELGISNCASRLKKGFINVAEREKELSEAVINNIYTLSRALPTHADLIIVPCRDFDGPKEPLTTKNGVDI